MSTNAETPMTPLSALREALKPFAKEADKFEGEPDKVRAYQITPYTRRIEGINSHEYSAISVEDLRRARQALASVDAERLGKSDLPFAEMLNYDKSIHTNPDAAAWARFFKETCDNLGKECDESWMITWFANAMMAMHDHMRLTDVTLSERAHCGREGWKLVPLLPTANMLKAGADEVIGSTHPNTSAERSYRAMLSASPSPPPSSDITPERIREIAERDYGPLLDLMSVAASNYSLSLPAASFGAQLIYSHRIGLARAILTALTAHGVSFYERKT